MTVREPMDLITDSPAATVATPSLATGVPYEVVHQMRGRIRLRIPRLAHDSRFAQRLLDATMGVPGLEHARVSPRASSLVITYEPSRTYCEAGRPSIPASGIDGMPGTGSAMLAQLVECIRTAADADIGVAGAPSSQATTGGRALAGHAGDTRGDAHIDYVKRLCLPALGLGLSTGALAGVAIPGALMGGVVLVAAIPIFRRAAQGIREQRRLPVDVLDALSIVLMTAQGLYFPPAVIVGVIEGAEIIRDRTARRAGQATQDYLLSRGRRALVERNGRPTSLAWDRIEAGDVIALQAGDPIPADGIVLDGSAMIDQHRLTGTAALALREDGDAVQAMTLVVEGRLRIRATRAARETPAISLMAQSQSTTSADSRVSNHARKVGDWAVVPTLATGAAVWATSGSLARATGIIGLDLGTGMRVSAPIAILNAQAYAAQRGIMIRHGRALEALARVDTVVFDKTATMTEGRVRVIDVRSLIAGARPRDILRLAASADHALDHPVADAIARYAREHDIHLRPCERREYRVGLGVMAEVDGRTVHVGNRTLMERAGIDVAAGRRAGRDAAAATRVYVARDGELVGVIACVDALRPEGAAVVADLRDRRIAALLASGDSKRATRAAAASLGIAPEHVHAEALPQQKMELVAALQARGKTVAVVGDGINDAAAMARANVSISFTAATDLARETADVVLLNDDLRDLIVTVEIARRAMGIVRQNRTLVVVPNVAAIAYASLATLSPVAAAVVNNGAALVAAFNSLRPLDGPGTRDEQMKSNGGPPLGRRHTVRAT